MNRPTKAEAARIDAVAARRKAEREQRMREQRDRVAAADARRKLAAKRGKR